MERARSGITFGLARRPILMLVDLILEDYVGWGPGAKVLGSAHTGTAVEEPIIATGLIIKPVRVGSAQISG